MLVPRNQIVVSDRQRKTFDNAKHLELRDSIIARGLLHAPAVRRGPEPDTYILVVGERRLRAIDAIFADAATFTYDGNAVPRGSVPVTLLNLDSLSSYLGAEFEENSAREDLSWQERDAALVAIHQQLEAEAAARNEKQTVIETARQVVDAGGIEGLKTVSAVRVNLAEALVLADYTEDPDIQKARNHNEAFNIVLQREAEAVRAAQIKRRAASVAASPMKQTIEIRNGDSFLLLPLMTDEGRFDLILSDPPYGIGAHQGGFRDRAAQHHNYEDTDEVARAAIKLLLIEGWRLTKPTANIFCFGDIDLFPYFKDQAAAMGWTPFRTPITWRKSESEGLAPWGRKGFRRTVEWIFYATKGQRGLIASPIDVLTVKRVHRSERLFGAQKPLDLMDELIEAATIPGDQVLDPFLGSGATLASARRLQRLGLGIEKHTPTYNTAMSFVFTDEDKLPPEEQTNV